MTRQGRDPALEALMEQIARTHGFRCDAYKQGCIRRRIGVRMRARAAPSYTAYAELLRRDPAESQRLLDALTIHVSRFYRNPETWDLLRTMVVPDVWRRRRAAPRCWSAGCAGGEEPYTLAMVLLEHAGGVGAAVPRATIDATDYDRPSLARLAAAEYPRAATKDLPPDFAARYLHGADPVTVRPGAREAVHAAQHDITRDPPPAPPYDLILCRNVAIYFDSATQERIASMLTDALVPGGYLVLGKVETVRGEARKRLALENPRERVYRRA